MLVIKTISRFLLTFLAASHAALFGVAPKLQSCSDSAGMKMDWVDSTFAQSQKPKSRNVGSVFCYFAEGCNDSITQRLDLMNIGIPNRIIDFKIYVDSVGKIADLTWSDSVLSERAFPQLFNSIPNGIILKSRYANGTMFGSLKSDSTGLLSYLLLENFVPKDTSKKSVSIKQISELIAHIGSRTPKSILEVVRSNVAYFQQIYQRYLRTNPGISGKISIKFTISPQGDIVSIARLSSNTTCFPLDKEIVEAAKMMKFDSIPFGNVTVTYAFVLEKN